jgi:type IX secretion system PorP/SprF family membrane protein
MKDRILVVLSLSFVFQSFLVGQETDYGTGYHTILVNNPAFSGMSEEGEAGLSYLNFYPGNGYNFHTFYFSYDSYFPAIHGGAGVYVADDYLGGIVNDVRGGLSYSYALRANKDLFINAGLSASVFHRGFNFNNAVLPDQIDGMGMVTLPTAEALSNAGRTVLDIGTGFLVTSGNYFGGFSVSHLTQPDLGGSGSSSDRLKRKYMINLAADFELNKRIRMRLRPLAAAEIQGKFLSVSEGAVLETRYLSFNTVFFENNAKNIDLQAGFLFRKENLSFYYNYRFNIKSGNSLLPFSLMHQTGLVFSLNNVEKRMRVKTINVPGL